MEKRKITKRILGLFQSIRGEHKENKSKREIEKVISRRDARALYLYNLASKPNLYLGIPAGEHLCNLDDLHNIRRNVYTISGLISEHEFCRGERTGYGYGDFHSFGFSDKEGLVAVAGLHHGDSFRKYEGIGVYSPRIETNSLLMFDPAENSIESIREPVVRNFVSAFYEGWGDYVDEKHIKWYGHPKRKDPVKNKIDWGEK